MLPLRIDSVLPMRGELPFCAAYVAHKIRAQLVVISESDIKNGHEAVSIVEQAGVPIMISRIKRAGNTVIAATDMTEHDFPVVHEGAAVAGVLGAPLTIVHNVQPQVPMPVPVASAMDGSMYTPVMPEEELEQVRKQKTVRLEELATEIGKAEVEVMQNMDTVGSILDLAKKQQADIVVVGHHKRRWLGYVFGDTFATLAVERSTRSIVVVPMG